MLIKAITFFFPFNIVQIERGLFVVEGLSGRISYPRSFNGSFPPEKNEPHIYSNQTNKQLNS